MKPSELDQILRLRLVVARLGESDLLSWWNSRYLGRAGQSILRPQFPRTLRLAQARSAFLVATERCRSVVEREGCHTFWSLPAALEIALEGRLHRLSSPSAEWNAFFESLQGIGAITVFEAVQKLEILPPEMAESARPALPGGVSGAIELPGSMESSLGSVLALALGFDAGRKGELAVPCLRGGA